MPLTDGFEIIRAEVGNYRIFAMRPLVSAPSRTVRSRGGILQIGREQFRRLVTARCRRSRKQIELVLDSLAWHARFDPGLERFQELVV